MDFVGSIYNQSKVVVVGDDMELLIEFIRKVVILVLLMELVLCLQPGKHFEPYLKMLVGVMITYTLVSHMLSAISGGLVEMEQALNQYKWASDYFFGEKEEVDYETEVSLSEIEDTNIHISLGEVNVKKVKIEEIKIENGYGKTQKSMEENGSR